MKTFSVILKKFKKETGMTDEEIAMFLGESVPSVRRWEAERTEPHSIVKSFCLQRMLERLLGIS